MLTTVCRASPPKRKLRSWSTDCNPSSWRVDLNCDNGLAMLPQSLATYQECLGQRTAYSGSPRRQLTLKSARLDSNGTASLIRCDIRVEFQNLPCATSIDSFPSSTTLLGSLSHTLPKPRSSCNVSWTRKEGGMVPIYRKTCFKSGSCGKVTFPSCRR